MLKIVESGVAGKNWYRKWSDGWIEQGGFVATKLEDTDDRKFNPFKFNVSFTAKPVSFVATLSKVSNTGTASNVTLKYDGNNDILLNKDGFTVVFDSTGNDANNGFYWEACGY